MIVRKGNVFAHIPEQVSEELFETVAGAGKLRIERIVSSGQASPEGFWYDQDENEWVMVLEGSAGLRFEGEDEIVVLNPGDWVDIPVHVRHRVEWTDAERKTVWLAVFY